MMKIMLRKRSAQLLLLGALTLAIGGVTFSTPASGAPVVSGPMANSAVKGLIRADLIRAEIVTFAGDQVGDNWVYRGVVRKVRGRQLTLAERDGSVIRIKLSSATQINIDYRTVTAKRVRPGMRATVMVAGNAAASWLYVARRSPDRSVPKIRALLLNGFMRAEVVSWGGGAEFETRADTGVIASVDSNSTSLVLQEDDGTSVDMQLGDASDVWLNGLALSTGDLVAGMKATTIGSGDGVISQIWAQDRKKSSGGKT
jgi:hypothetical protein